MASPNGNDSSQILAGETIHPYILQCNTAQKFKVVLASRRSTCKWCELAARKGLVHTKDGGVDSQAGGRQCSEEVDDIKGVPEDLLLVTTHPSRDTAVHALNEAGLWVVALLGKDGIFLTIVSDHEEWREGVGELQNTCCTNKCGQVANLWNSGGDDEGQAPVDRNCGHKLVDCHK